MKPINYNKTNTLRLYQLSKRIFPSLKGNEKNYLTYLKERKAGIDCIDNKSFNKAIWIFTSYSLKKNSKNIKVQAKHLEDILCYKNYYDIWVKYAEIVAKFNNLKSFQPIYYHYIYAMKRMDEHPYSYFMNKKLCGNFGLTHQNAFEDIFTSLYKSIDAYTQNNKEDKITKKLKSISKWKLCGKFYSQDNYTITLPDILPDSYDKAYANWRYTKNFNLECLMENYKYAYKFLKNIFFSKTAAFKAYKEKINEIKEAI